MIARISKIDSSSNNQNIIRVIIQNWGQMVVANLIAMIFILPLAQAQTNTETQTELPLDTILTIVNDDVITATELEHRLRKTRAQLTGDGIKLPPEELLRKQILDRFILERIQLQHAAKLGIRSNDQDIERAISIIARKNNISHENFLKKLKTRNIDIVSYRQQLGRQVIIQKLSEREVNRRIRVSDSEIDLFIENRNRQMGNADAYNLSHIMIPIPENASSDAIGAARKLSQQVLKKLVNGANFSSTAIGYSKSKEAMEGGKLGWRSTGELPEIFINAISGLEPGQISQIIRSPNGFHILQVNDKRSTRTSKKVTQTRARHILLKPSAIRSEKETMVKIKQLKERIENGESFSTLAKAYSEDPLSAAEGGELGWVNPGQMVSPFEKAMNALAVNKLSGLVKSNFGYHLIEVLERQEKDIGKQLDRSKVRRQIHQRKSEEKYQQWIRRIRDESFVRHMNQDLNS